MPGGGDPVRGGVRAKYYGRGTHLPGEAEESGAVQGVRVLQINVKNTVGMVCRPYQAAGNQSDVAYGRRMTGEGPTYRERQKGRVQCRECREEMVAVSLAWHRMTHNELAEEKRWNWKTSATGEKPRTYRMTLPAKGDLWRCLVEG